MILEIVGQFKHLHAITVFSSVLRPIQCLRRTVIGCISNVSPHINSIGQCICKQCMQLSQLFQLSSSSHSYYFRITVHIGSISNAFLPLGTHTPNCEKTILDRLFLCFIHQISFHFTSIQETRFAYCPFPFFSLDRLEIIEHLDFPESAQSIPNFNALHLYNGTRDSIVSISFHEIVLAGVCHH